MTELHEIKKILHDHKKRISQLEGTSRPERRRQAKSSKNLTDLLIEFKQAGFFKQPKFLGEVREKLAQEGHHYSSTSLSGPLQKAVKNHTLGRIKKDGKWAYVNR
jgi:hypothetical protein